MNLEHITAQEYDQIINEEKKTCVVVFTKPTCSVCKELAPMMEEVAKEYENDTRINFYNIDVATEDGLALFKSLKLIGVPQSVFFKEGQQNEAIPGAINQKIIRTEIAAVLGEKPQGFMGKLKSLFGK